MLAYSLLEQNHKSIAPDAVRPWSNKIGADFLEKCCSGCSASVEQ